MSIGRIEDMTMDTFKLTDHNRANYNVCKEMLSHPDCFRLIFFHLPSSEGLHLKYAIINFWKDSVNWRSVTMKEFTNDLLTEIYKGTRPFDMSKYDEPDVLLVDDVQQIAKKEATQEEFYNILKRRLESKKLTVIFSPYSIEHLSMSTSNELIQLLLLGVPEEA